MASHILGQGNPVDSLERSVKQVQRGESIWGLTLKNLVAAQSPAKFEQWDTVASIQFNNIR